MTVQTTIAVPAQRRHRSLAVWVIAIAGLTIAAATLILSGQAAGAESGPPDPSPPAVASSQPALGTAGPYPAGSRPGHRLQRRAPSSLRMSTTRSTAGGERLGSTSIRSINSSFRRPTLSAAKPPPHSPHRCTRYVSFPSDDRRSTYPGSRSRFPASHSASGSRSRQATAPATQSCSDTPSTSSQWTDAGRGSSRPADTGFTATTPAHPSHRHECLRQ